MLDISQISLGQGVLGICPMPGRSGLYEADLQTIRRQSAIFDGGLRCAARLARMLKIIEMALLCQQRQIGKHRRNTIAGLRKPQFAHPRRIDEPAAH